MYRQGLGDCFLLTFQQKAKDAITMLIDCGLLQGTPNAKEIMQCVVEDIKGEMPFTREVDGDEKPWIDYVLLTHEHIDHISGFAQAKAIFDEMHFGQVWAAWTEDEGHPKYNDVRDRFKKQIAGLKAATLKMSTIPEMAGLKESIDHIVEDFFEPTMLGVGSRMGRSETWEYAIGKSVDNPKYCSPGDTFTIEGLDDVRVYVLGPPLDYETFTKVDPPPEETYRSEWNNFALSDSFFAAVAESNEVFDPEMYEPFEKHLKIGETDAQSGSHYSKFFIESYGFDDGGENDWRRINNDWLNVTGNLALNLDTFTNNTCLAIAIEFVKSKKVLLFPGDAQFANWISWQKLTFEVPDETDGKRQVKVDDLLKQTVFYKVGHHGSHNATLKKHGLERMSNPDLMAMIPVDRKMARSKTSKTNPDGWEMPEENLYNRLKELTRGRVILADEDNVADLKKRCKDTKFLKKVSFGGELKIDEGESQGPLYIDLNLEF
jgi:hypothetical protein